MPLILRWLTSLISLRGLVLLGGLLVLGGGFPTQWSDRLQQPFFQLAMKLVPAAYLPTDIALIELDTDTLNALREDPLQSPALPLLLQPQTQVALVLTDAWRERRLPAEALLQALPASADPELTAWRQRQARQQTLQQRMLRGELLLGLTAGGVAAFPEQAYPLVSRPDRTDTWRQRLPPTLARPLQRWLDGSTRLQVPAWPVNPRLQSPAYRALDATPPGWPRQLLWQQESQWHPDLALALYLHQVARAVAVAEEPSLVYQHRYWLEMAHLRLPFSVTGRVWVPPAPPEHFAHYSLAQALSQPPSESIWLLGDDLRTLHTLGTALAALQQGKTQVQPAWSQWLQGALVLLALIYLLWLQPRLRVALALMITALVGFGLGVAQVAWQLSYQQVLPLPLVLAWFVAASGLMMLWRQQQRRWRRLGWEHHNVSYQLAQQWYQQGRLDEARVALRPCHPSQAVLALWYDIGVQQERRRQYREAAQTYQQLVARKPGYKDAQKRARALQQIAEPATVSSDFSATHSLVLPHQEFSKPVLGRYQIERELGRGAMGVVYLGLDPKIARRVAIKTLSYREFDTADLNLIKERFFREAEAAGRLSHPHIVTVYDLGEEADLAFIAMDYVEGRSLDHCVSQASLLPLEQVFEVVAAVADALDYAHRQQVVHRDIKPGNIIYDQASGQVKVADFGIARIVDDSKTKTGDMLGSPVYMSPEQLKGEKVTGASDIYSLGVTFYQLLTATLPFTGDSIANLAYQILNKKYVSVRERRPELSAAVVRVVNKALQKDAAKRYASAGEMAQAVRGLLARESTRRKAG
ncbi:MAG: serine/threonine-protein kinase [Pseudomonadota bacterium]|nr:serine/threonine-protein kinase [Pseudomonadota bacterium]